MYKQTWSWLETVYSDRTIIYSFSSRSSQLLKDHSWYCDHVGHTWTDTWTYRSAPARLSGHLRLRVDAVKLGQSFLLNLLQMSLQRQISIGEESKEHNQHPRSVQHESFRECVCERGSTWRCWGDNAWRETVSAPPTSGQGWPEVPHLTPQSRCGLDTACSGGAGHTPARFLTAEIISNSGENKVRIKTLPAGEKCSFSVDLLETLHPA